MDLPVEKALMEQIIRAIQEDHYDAAAKLLHPIMTTPNPPAELCYIFARLFNHYSLGSQHEQAQTALLQAIEQQPGYQEAHAMLGHTLTCLDEFEQAGYHLRLAIALKPDDYIAWARLSNLYAKMGNRNATIEAQRQAVKYAPTHKLLLRRLSELLAEEQDGSPGKPEE